MGTPPSSIDKAIAKAQRGAFLADLRKMRWPLVAFLAATIVAVACLVAINASPRRDMGLIEGRIEASFATPSKYNPHLQVTVELADGRKIVVAHPRGLAYQPHARVQLRAFEHTCRPGSRVYVFERYMEEP